MTSAPSSPTQPLQIGLIDLSEGAPSIGRDLLPAIAATAAGAAPPTKILKSEKISGGAG
jgi:hypothetical protein